METLNYEMMKNHQAFGSVEDMDLSVRGFLYSFKASLSESTVKVLNFIWRHSVKVAGVSFAKFLAEKQEENSFWSESMNLIEMD